MSKSRKKAEDAVAEEAASPETASPAEPVAEEVVEPEDTVDGTDEVEELDPLDAMRAERDAFQEKWLRAVAEMENVRKRARRDVQDSRRFAQADILRPFLDVHDNFERALQSLPNDEDTGGGAGLREGVDLIFQKFRSVLKEKGVESIPALDAEFDPRVHEAVGQMEREGVEAGVVIEVVQPGYVLGGEFVLRPARVIVAG
jgi:molecular chaperone GrpE